MHVQISFLFVYLTFLKIIFCFVIGSYKYVSNLEKPRTLLATAFPLPDLSNHPCSMVHILYSHPFSWIKLNLDGAAEGNLASTVQIIRSYEEGWLNDFSKRIGIYSSLVAKLKGNLIGLHI